MGERILYFWLRFRWYIVAGVTVLTVLAGALGGTFTRQGATPSNTSTPQSSAEDALVVAGGENALAACDGIANREELFACRVSLEPRTPIVLNADRQSFLVNGSWQTADGMTDVISLPGAEPGLLEKMAAGVTVDLDNDGFPEYVIASGADGGAVLRVLSENPGGGLRDTAKIRGLDGIQNVNLVLPIDANHDGWLDLVVSSTREPEGDGQEQTANPTRIRRGLDIFLNRGWEAPGTFEPAGIMRIAPTGNGAADAPIFLVDHLVDGHVSDIDGDGELDIVVVDRRGGAAIYWGSREARWGDVRPLEFRVPIGVTGLDLGDADGDGDTDLVVSYDVSLGSAFGNLCPVQLNGRPCRLESGMSLYGGVAVVTQETGRNFLLSEPLSIKDIRNASDVALVDLDGDRYPAIVVSRETIDGSGGVTAYRPEIREGGTVSFQEADRIGDEAVSKLRASDLNRDGLPDIVMTGRGSAKTLLWLNTNTSGRYIHLDIRGGAGFTTVGTSRSALGAQVTITDVDNKIVTTHIDSDQLEEGLLVALPLIEGAWAGTEAVPRIEIVFPVTGRTLTLTNTPTGVRQTVDEPAK